MPDTDYLDIEPVGISIVTPDYPVQIMEGCTITNESGTKSHQVKESDKHILLKEPGNRVVFKVKPEHRGPVEEECRLWGRPIYFNTPFNRIIVPDRMFFAPAPYNFYDKVIQPRYRGCLVTPKGKNEERAIETLREMITEEEFRRYLKYGFITVESQSGKIYQICQKNKHVKVWYKGELVEEVCVYIRDRKIPLTDKIIAFKAIIESDENEFRSMGNIYKLKKKAA